MFWRVHMALVSMFIPPPFLVPPSDRSVGLPYIPNSLDTRIEGLWWSARGIECAEMMGKTSSESYAPSPPSDVFWHFSMPYGQYRHDPFHSRFLYYVSVVPDVLEGSLGSGKHVHPPTPSCTSLWLLCRALIHYKFIIYEGRRSVVRC